MLIENIFANKKCNIKSKLTVEGLGQLHIKSSNEITHQVQDELKR